MKTKNTRYLTEDEIKHIRHFLIENDTNLYKFSEEIGLTNVHLYKIIRGEAPITKYVLGLLEKAGLSLNTTPHRSNKSYNMYVCPKCAHEVEKANKYCSECGLKLNWKGVK